MNLLQHIKNDTDSTNVLENDYISLVCSQYDSKYVGITCLVILNILIWQFILMQQIDKFKLLSIISDKSKKI
jgi:hypothetical protein